MKTCGTDRIVTSFQQAIELLREQITVVQAA